MRATRLHLYGGTQRPPPRKHFLFPRKLTGKESSAIMGKEWSEPQIYIWSEPYIYI